MSRDTQANGQERQQRSEGTRALAGPAVATVYFEDDVLTWADGTVETLFGRERTAVVGLDVDELFADPLSDALERPIEDAEAVMSARTENRSLSRRCRLEGVEGRSLYYYESSLDGGRFGAFVDVVEADDRSGSGIETDDGSVRATDHAAVLVRADGTVLARGGASGVADGVEAGDDVSALTTGATVERPSPERLFERARRDGRASNLVRRVRGDGSVVRDRVLAVPVENRSGAVSGFALVVRELTDGEAQARNPDSEAAFTRSILDAQRDVFYAIDRGGNFVRWNDRFSEVTGYEDHRIPETNPTDFFVESDRGTVARAIAEVLRGNDHGTVEATLLTADGRRIPYEFNGSAITDWTGAIVGLTGVGRDVSTRVARERALRTQRDRLERLDRINSAVRGVDRALVDAETRSEVETSVVDHLANTDPYELAVVGEFDVDYGSVRPRAWAGTDGEFVEQSVSTTPDGPCATAVRTGTVSVLDDVASTSTFDPWFGSGDRDETVAAVPLVAGERTFGILVLFVHREHPFGERERSVLAELGETIGDAIAFVETRRLLHADEVLELSFAR